MDKISQSGVYNLTAEAYHGDEFLPEPSLSSSLARTLLSKTPLHAWASSRRLQAAFPDVDGVPEELKDTEAFDIGTAAHAILLGRGGDIDVVVADAWTTKVAKKARAASREAGRTPLLVGQYEATLQMVARVRSKLAGAGIELDPQRSEMAAVARIEGVWCRALVDNAPAWPSAPLLDLKTCMDASPEACLRSIQSYDYAVQWRWYREVWEAATGERRNLLFVFVEKTPPHSCQIIELYNGRGEGDWSADAAEQCAEARRIFKACIETGQFPDYPTRIATLYAPQWYRNRWADKQTVSPSAEALRTAREAQAPRAAE